MPIKQKKFKKGETIPFREFVSEENYIYYSPLFNDFLFGSHKIPSGIHLHIGTNLLKKALKIKLYYIGEL